MLLSLLSKRSLEVDSRDTYGFTVRPQHLHRYREYAHIYKEEEEERSQKWNEFLECHVDSAPSHSGEDSDSRMSQADVTEQRGEVSHLSPVKTEFNLEASGRSDHSSGAKTVPASETSWESFHQSEDKRVPNNCSIGRNTEPTSEGSEEAVHPCVGKTEPASEKSYLEKTERASEESGEIDHLSVGETESATKESGEADVLTLDKSEPTLEESEEAANPSEGKTEPASGGSYLEKTVNVLKESREADHLSKGKVESNHPTLEKSKPVSKASEEADYPSFGRIESVSEGSGETDHLTLVKTEPALKESGQADHTILQRTESASRESGEAEHSGLQTIESATLESGEAERPSLGRTECALEERGEANHPSVEQTDPSSEESREADHRSVGKTELALEVSWEGDQSSSEKAKPGLEVSGQGDHSCVSKTVSDVRTEGNIKKEVPRAKQTKTRVKKLAQIRPSLNAIDNMMKFRVKRRKNMGLEHITSTQDHLRKADDIKSSRAESEREFEVEFHDNEVFVDSLRTSVDGMAAIDEVSLDPFFPWKQELESLVQGGVPRDLRGEVWQAFVGVRTRRLESYYQNLLGPENDAGFNQEHVKPSSGNESKKHNGDRVGVPENLRRQIEKDLPRTFPGHPALDEDGRNALRRVLIAYARHNPSVGYCQAMNFFAGLLLLMMPEENAFWTLVGIMDDYFDGYFSQEMIESQVDQLVFEDLMRERFPKLVNHLDYLGVQVAWLSGPWFLSIFVNMLPWESVLRVWDVLLFEGNRVMLFRTAFALMELYGPAIVTTKDAGDAMTLLQSLTGSTFDSSQLVLTACMGFFAVTEDRLHELRNKHRPAVLETTEERSTGVQVFKDSKSLASKLYSFKHGPGSLVKEKDIRGTDDRLKDGNLSDSKSHSAAFDEFLTRLSIESEVDSLADLQEQVGWLKVELCRLLEEKRSATLRAEELETALMEMVQQDNRRQLSARIEQLEHEVAELRQALSDKEEQENAMLQVLIRVEHEQKVTEDARRFSEQDAAAQKYALHVLQEKYDQAMASLAQMEKRVVMAESLLEATLQYESGQNKVHTPRVVRSDSSQDTTKRKGLLSFGLGWSDWSKNKTTAATSETIEVHERSPTPAETNGLEETERQKNKGNE